MKKTVGRIFRIILGVTIIILVLYYYLESINDVIEKENEKNRKQAVKIKTDLISPSDVFEENYFYKNGEGKFSFNEKDKIITIEPLDDMFVSLSRQIPLKGVEVNDLVLSFRYKYELSGNNNPQKQGGVAFILVSSKGNRNVYTTYPLCSTISKDWKQCEYSLGRAGKLRMILIRFGGTSFYKSLSFKDIKLYYEGSQDVNSK